MTAKERAHAQLGEAQQKLIATSRQVGMAEVATGVLHNVGNVLNSVNVSVNVISDQLGRSQAVHLGRICALLDSHRADLGVYMTSDVKGSKIPEFLAHLAAALDEERAQFARELQALQKNVEHIKEIVTMQQSYAKVAGFTEDVPAADLMEDAISMTAESFQRGKITLQRQFADAPLVRTDKHKVLQILVNLIRNAKHAMDATSRDGKILTVGVNWNGGPRVRIVVSDNGIGIAPENLTRIFSHGFTTKKNGHGFGLHSGALAAKEMGGSLQAFSEGPGLGATFVLELPIATDNPNRNHESVHE